MLSCSGGDPWSGDLGVAFLMDIRPPAMEKGPCCSQISQLMSHSMPRSRGTAWLAASESLQSAVAAVFWGWPHALDMLSIES